MNHSNEPSLPSAIDLVRALRKSGRAAEARALIARMPASPPPDLYNGQIGIDMNYLGLYAEAEPILRRALLDPHSPLNRYMIAVELAICLFAQGKYDAGRALLREARDTPNADSLLHVVFSGDQPWIDLFRPKLLGKDESVAGKRIFIPMEGGFGDFVNYSRYIDALLRDGAAEVTIEAFEAFQDVVRPTEGVRLSPGYGETRAAEAQRCDRLTFVFDLFTRYQVSPFYPAYDPGAFIELSAGTQLPPEALALLQRGEEAPKVGLMWRSVSVVRHEPYRSIQLESLAHAFAGTNCRLYSLQVGELSESEREIMREMNIADLAPHLTSFGMTGRAYEHLDVVISVDSGPAHLAAALNRPVWLLLAQACDSRWYDCQRFTPWYPSMRLYRQTELGDWTAPLADLRADLGQLR